MSGGEQSLHDCVVVLIAFSIRSGTYFASSVNDGLISGWRLWTVQNKAQYSGFWWRERNPSLDGTRIVEW